MKSQKEVNRLIESILGEPKMYDLRCELRIVESYLSYDEAHARYTYLPEEDKHTYTITSSHPDNYSEDVNLALSAAKRIAEKNEHTFVLSYEDGEWKAAYGDYGDCAEYKGGNPAFVTCMSILKFMGKV
jgi:hypothetical protein